MENNIKKVCEEKEKTTEKLKGDIGGNVTSFDKSEEYRNEIYPIVLELIKKCSLHDIPMFVSCCIQNDENGSVYKHSSVTADTHRLTLSRDFFPDFALITLGAKAKLQVGGPVSLGEEEEGVIRISKEDKKAQKYAFDFDEE